MKNLRKMHFKDSVSCRRPKDVVSIEPEWLALSSFLEMFVYVLEGFCRTAIDK